MSCSKPGPRSGVLRLSLLVFLGAFAGFCVVEGILQIAAGLVGGESRRGTSSFGAAVVLFLGDSNTYGLYVAREQAYPSVFERLWFEEKRQPSLEAVNLGYPGTNSTLVASQFAELLSELRPRVVTIMVGANDFWTVPMRAQRNTGVLERTMRFLWRHLRTLRLVYFWWREQQLLRVEVPEDFRSSPQLLPPSWRSEARVGSLAMELGYELERNPRAVGQERMEGLKENLTTMVRQARRSGACVLLVTYPAEGGLYGVANQLIRTVARQENVRLVDLGEQFASSCPLLGSELPLSSRSHCPAELFPDQHLTAQGHQKVARLLLDPVMSCLQ